MKITIDIPKEFIHHYRNDMFINSLRRLKEDADYFAGSYEEKETAEMLCLAFQKSIIVNDDWHSECEIPIREVDCDGKDFGLSVDVIIKDKIGLCRIGYYDMGIDEWRVRGATDVEFLPKNIFPIKWKYIQ